MKFILFVFWLIIQTASAAPAQYTILPIDTPPVIDGNLVEWNGTYFIDSLRSDDNILLRDSVPAWTSNDFQYMVYSAYDDSNVYFGMKITSDDVLIKGNPTSYCNDALWITPGGREVGFSLLISGEIRREPSCHFIIDSTLFAAVDPAGNSPFATAEFCLKRAVLDPFNFGSFQLCVGFQENDLPDCQWGFQFGGIGVYYIWYKHDFSDQWKNPAYYPTFTLGQVKVESHLTAKAPETLTASPNPFTPSTTLRYNVKNDGSLKIYDMSGKEVTRFSISGAGRAVWDAAGLAAGVYLARLASGKDVRNTRLFLIK